MSKIHKKVLEKKVRYDSYLEIDTIVKLEQICEAHKKEIGEMLVKILDEYYKKDPNLKTQQSKIKELKSKFRQGLLFKVSEDGSND